MCRSRAQARKYRTFLAEKSIAAVRPPRLACDGRKPIELSEFGRLFVRRTSQLSRARYAHGLGEPSKASDASSWWSASRVGSPRGECDRAGRAADPRPARRPAHRLENIRSGSDYRKWVIQRDTYPADLVRRLVPAHNRRALIVWANGHLLHQEILTNYDMTNWQAQTIVSLIEAQGGAPVFTVRQEGSVSQWQPDAASWKPMSLTLVRGTILGAADFSEFENPSQRYRIRGDDDFVPIPRDQWVKRPLEEIVDAVLYVGPASGRTSAGISPTLCADPAYIKMRFDRIALINIAEADKVKRDCNLK